MDPSSVDPCKLLNVGFRAKDYEQMPELHYSSLQTLASVAEWSRKSIKNTLAPFCSKDPAGIVCSYLLIGDENISLLFKLRQYIVVGNYTRNVMIYSYMLSETVGGPDLLGYEYLVPKDPIVDPDFKLVTCMENMILYAPHKMSISTVVRILDAMVKKDDYVLTDREVEDMIEESYARCITETRSERKEGYIICPYCLDTPIKYNYYLNGHQRTKKHGLNRRNVPKSGNYFRALLREGYDRDLMAIAKASISDS